MARGLNKVLLIGNLTRDPELKYTPSGSAVCTFSIATNRQWKDESGGNKEEVEFHRIVAWSKLAEICGQYLKKGSKVYVEGRIQSRKWQTKEGEDRTTFEIVMSEMMMLDSKGSASDYTGPSDDDISVPENYGDSTSPAAVSATSSSKGQVKEDEAKGEVEDNSDDDIPF